MPPVAPPAPHNFQPDSLEPGYRPHCKVCGVGPERHPYHSRRIPTPRQAAA